MGYRTLFAAAAILAMVGCGQRYSNRIDFSTIQRAQHATIDANILLRTGKQLDGLEEVVIGSSNQQKIFPEVTLSPTIGSILDSDSSYVKGFGGLAGGKKGMLIYQDADASPIAIIIPYTISLPPIIPREGILNDPATIKEKQIDIGGFCQDKDAKSDYREECLTIKPGESSSGYITLSTEFFSLPGIYNCEIFVTANEPFTATLVLNTPDQEDFQRVNKVYLIRLKK